VSYRAFITAGLLALSSSGLAQGGVYKCYTDDAGTIYRDTPCEAGQAQHALLDIPPKVPAQVQELAADRGEDTGAARSDLSPPRVAPSAFELLKGMSDTKVLNLRGWGRPQKILRARGPEGWREHWTYTGRAQGSTSLLFVNGKLEGATTEGVAEDAPTTSSATDNAIVGNLAGR